MWRRFSFFTTETRELPSNDVHKSWVSGDIGRGKGGADVIVFCLKDGRVQVFDDCFQLLAEYRAYAHSATSVRYLEQSNTLATVGYDDSSVPLQSTLFKVWDLGTFWSNVDKPAPPCTRAVKLFSTKFPVSQVTALDVIELNADQFLVAVGLTLGSVYLIRGDFARERVSRSRVLVSAAEPGFSDEITGIALRKVGSSVILYATTKMLTVSFDLENQLARYLLDNHGANLNCVTKSLQDFIIGRDEAIYFYGADGRGACLAFAERKMHVTAFNDFLLVVSASGKTPTLNESLQLTIYDLKNRLIAHQMPLSGIQQHILCSSSGMVIVIQDVVEAFILSERPTHAKLELLFRKNLYGNAISLISSSGASAADVAQVQCKYGDHLYVKQDYDGAMEQYLQTIGWLEPSYVIKKFLDVKKIYNLALYLEKLQTYGVAREEHTTLLLTCYTKLKDSDKIDKFITALETEQSCFNVNEVIRICRSSGYTAQALRAADVANSFDKKLSIIIQDMGDCHMALNALEGLSESATEVAFRQHSHHLISMFPQGSRSLLGKKFLQCTLHKSQRLANLLNDSDSQPYVISDVLKEIMKVLDEQHQISLPPNVFGAILELLLEQDQFDESHSDIAIKLLRRAWHENDNPHFDACHALLICSKYSFHKGIAFLCGRMQRNREILGCHMAQQDFERLYEFAMQLEAADPRIWLELMSNFSSKDDGEIYGMLSHVGQLNELPTHSVLKALCQNPEIRLSSVKNYIINSLFEDETQIQENIVTVEKCRREGMKMHAELDELLTSPRIFQNNRCALCNSTLELPAVHFLCMHSFHSQCFGEGGKDCRRCASSNITLMDIGKTLKATTCNPDKFFQVLESSKDGFAIMVEHLGRYALD